MTKYSVGDLVAIPTGARFGIGKVIYVSKYFRSVILLKLYRTSLAEGTKKFPSVDSAADLYYTGSGLIPANRWLIVGSEAVSEAEQLMSKRIVGDGIWLADEYLGEASEKDLERLPKMLTYGFKLIEKAIGRLPHAQDSLVS